MWRVLGAVKHLNRYSDCQIVPTQTRKNCEATTSTAKTTTAALCVVLSMRNTKRARLPLAPTPKTGSLDPRRDPPTKHRYPAGAAGVQQAHVSSRTWLFTERLGLNRNVREDRAGLCIDKLCAGLNWRCVGMAASALGERRGCRNGIRTFLNVRPTILSV
jgi:hypothetical protein